jgi:hypothetical protein
MSESAAWSAFDEFDFARLSRFGPHALGHHFQRNCVLVLAGFFGQVHKRASLDFGARRSSLQF